ncbi:hypothetical protein Q31b_38420 [Novipirellula aureliae]|uniref:Uncharacterized protein n=1 Tax=Novipirellula aureliae TaxID=2527966 RepID=A0A5C6DRE1_9BACT|nr:hypothetical protein Q31b_38420 [Novipirellula aureliae]
MSLDSGEGLRQITRITEKMLLPATKQEAFWKENHPVGGQRTRESSLILIFRLGEEGCDRFAALAYPTRKPRGGRISFGRAVCSRHLFAPPSQARRKDVPRFRIPSVHAIRTCIRGKKLGYDPKQKPFIQKSMLRAVASSC